MPILVEPASEEKNNDEKNSDENVESAEGVELTEAIDEDEKKDPGVEQNKESKKESQDQ